jgi:hypothetical protein
MAIIYYYGGSFSLLQYQSLRADGIAQCALSMQPIIVCANAKEK